MRDIEYRAFAVPEFRLSRDDGGQLRIEGHAAVFGQSTDLGGMTEEVARGAFTEAIGRDDVRALFNHDANLILGRTKSGTLELREDEVGLFTSIQPPDTQYARDLAASIARRDVSEMSFGFVTQEDEWKTLNGVPHRTLKKVELWDISPVTFAAYPQTDVDVARRSLERAVIAAGKRGGGIPAGLATAIAHADLVLRRILLGIRKHPGG